jgi:DNA polymerase-3 subunit delta'
MAVKLTKKEQEQIAAAKAREAEEEELKAERIRMAHLLQKAQPAAYHLLDASLKENRLAHGYLFYGPRNALKKEMAMLAGESLSLAAPDGLLREEEITKEEEAEVRRIAHGNVPSFLVLDGEGPRAIAKEEVDGVQLQFAKTAPGGSGRRVWLMLRCENSSPGAQNSLLKFLEEPAPGVYAFLTADNVERVLPTIRSRCLLVPFQPLAPRLLEEEGRRQGLDMEDAWLLARLQVSLAGLTDLAASAAYQNAKGMFRQFLRPDRDFLAADYEVKWQLRAHKADSLGGSMSPEAAKDGNVQMLDYFFGLLMQFARDVLGGPQDGAEPPAWYHKAVLSARREKEAGARWTAVLKIAGQERDRVNRNNDLGLLMDQALYRLEVSLT